MTNGTDIEIDYIFDSVEGFVSNDVFCMGDLTVKGMDFAEAVKEQGPLVTFGKLVALFSPLDPFLTHGI